MFPQVRAQNAVWTGWWSQCGKVARPVGGRSVPTRRPPRWGAPSTRTRPSSTVIHRTAHRDRGSGASTDCVWGRPSTSSTGKPRRNPRVLDRRAWLWPGDAPRDHADVTTHSNPVDDCGQLGAHAVYEPPSHASGRRSADPVARYPQIRAPRWGTLWMVPGGARGAVGAVLGRRATRDEDLVRAGAEPVRRSSSGRRRVARGEPTGVRRTSDAGGTGPCKDVDTRRPHGSREGSRVPPRAVDHGLADRHVLRDGVRGSLRRGRDTDHAVVDDRAQRCSVAPLGEGPCERAPSRARTSQGVGAVHGPGHEAGQPRCCCLIRLVSSVTWL